MPCQLGTQKLEWKVPGDFLGKCELAEQVWHCVHAAWWICDCIPANSGLGLIFMHWILILTQPLKPGGFACPTSRFPILMDKENPEMWPDMNRWSVIIKKNFKNNTNDEKTHKCFIEVEFII